jgi:hypothetical protein
MPRDVRDVPPLTSIDQHYCGNEVCGAPLPPENVFDVPWVDGGNRYRRARGYICPGCNRRVIQELLYIERLQRWVSVDFHEFKGTKEEAIGQLTLGRHPFPPAADKPVNETTKRGRGRGSK